MKNPFHKIVLLILFLFASQFLIAQSISGEKKSEADKSTQTGSIGVKKQSTEPSNVSLTSVNQTHTEENTIQQPIQNNNSIPVTGTIQFDINQMPTDVQSKISDNKLSGKNLLDGVVKVFTAEIKSCIKADETKKEFSFLENETGFIRTEYVSKGIIKFIVQPQFDSVALKEKLLTAGINFNFLNEYYIINK